MGGEIEAAAMLIANREKVVQDITHGGPKAIGGGTLTQTDLKRVSASSQATVDAMIREVSGRLLGKRRGFNLLKAQTPVPANSEDAKVWAQAAAFLSKRVQGSPGECPGRKPDMSPRAAIALRKVLAQVEAANLLTSNRETIVKDITNAGPSAIGGGTLTQTNLKRVDANDAILVNSMITAVSARLNGDLKGVTSNSKEARVWAQAASFLYDRIQDSASACPGRAPDMSSDAAKMMRAALGEIEAAALLSSNRDKVYQDITNTEDIGIGGGRLTQTGLKRVGPKDAVYVGSMLSEVTERLVGNATSVATKSEDEKRVWAQAARFLSSRIQAPGDQRCPGRAPDMSQNAATRMRAVLKEIEAL